MEIELNNYKIDEKSIINLKIEHNKITGLIGNNNDKLISILALNVKDTNNIIINSIKVDNNNINSFKKRIKVVEDELDYNYYLPTIKDIMINEIKTNNIVLDDYYKKIIDSLKIVGLSKDYLEREVITISNLEKKLLLLSIVLLSNPSLVIIKEPFKDLDLVNRNKLLRFYNKIIERYHKTIIFISNDVNMLYNNTENIIYAKNNKVIESNKTEEFFKDIKKLKKNKIEIPNSIGFINMVKEKKNVKLTNYKDVRDILKDIYKHV